MLFDWVRSSGAVAELATAKALGIPVWYQVATELHRFMSYDRFSEAGRALYLGKAESPLRRVGHSLTGSALI